MTHSGSYFADAAAARRAVDLALPMIEPAMRDTTVCGSGFLHIVVMDPALSPQRCGFGDAVLLEHSVGDRDRWDADYAAFARGKARLAWESGMDSHALQNLRPHTLREGDSLLWGSVCLQGIVVAASGAHAWWDEAFATAIAANLLAIAKEGHASALRENRLRAG